MGKYIFLFVIATFSFFNVKAQNDIVKDSSSTEELQIPDSLGKHEETFQIVEEMPEYPGGQSELMFFLMKAPYPSGTKSSGGVKVLFVINVDGTTEGFEVVESSGDTILDEAALNYIKTMPKWKPGYQRGKPVRVKYVVPVKYKW